MHVAASGKGKSLIYDSPAAEWPGSVSSGNLGLLNQSTRPNERRAESREFKTDDPIFEIPKLVCARRGEKK